jgi:TatA/E family protein of Tat protein translocase
MLDIGIQELVVIMVLALLVFGPDKLPELGRRLGRAMREFRRASDEFRSTVEQNLQMNADYDIMPSSAASPPGQPEPVTGAATPDGSAGPMEVHGTGDPGAETGSPATLDGRPAGDMPSEPFWASRGGRLLHRRECVWRARVPASEQLPLKTALEGWEQGLRPCPACDPREAELAT